MNDVKHFKGCMCVRCEMVGLGSNNELAELRARLAAAESDRDELRQQLGEAVGLLSRCIKPREDKGDLFSDIAALVARHAAGEGQG